VLRVEIGGGTRDRGDGWVNVDQIDSADIVHDLNSLPWPFDDESVDELYSSHCIEHVESDRDFIREVARICRVGARVEIRAPDAMSEMANIYGHKTVFSINVVRHADHVFPELFWSNCDRRLKLDRIEYGADDYWFAKARSNRVFAHYSDEDILDWVPRTKHENRFHFTVVPKTT
jgi:ubiquinone/menaquinone biosynthesis C-methylase UbiE